VIEPAAGAGDIASVIREGHVRVGTQPSVLTNDLDPACECDYALDATLAETWDAWPEPDWTVGNPPFDRALAIVEHAIRRSTCGVAMLLRLSFLEPTTEGSSAKTLREEDVLLPGFERAARTIPPNPPRAEFWRRHPATLLLPTSRISFTGDGSTDSVTTGWVIWRRGGRPAIFPTVVG
jgi:hypothetical protein